MHVVKIPGQGNLALCFYPGNTAPETSYTVIDFFDFVEKKAVNSRATGFKFEIHNIVHLYALPDALSTAGFIRPGRLISWEVSWGIKDEDVKSGEERSSLPEGTTFKLVCDGRDHAFFRVAVRQNKVHLPHVLEAVP